MYGIDFGTSNTVVSVNKNNVTLPLELENQGTVVPSLLYFERNKPFSIGLEAINNYTEALERLKKERNLYTHFRFFQGLKFALRDPLFSGTAIFGKRYQVENLVGIFIKELKKKADSATGSIDKEIVIGRPVVLSNDSNSDTTIIERYRNACLFAGFEKVHFVEEPIAAAISLLGKVEGLVLIFDFGGGTLDIAIAQLTKDSAKILASAGIELGGYTLNEDISRARIIQYFGFGSNLKTMSGTILEIPRWITNQVASFYALPLNDISKTRDTIKDLIFESYKKNALKGLNQFLDKNLSFSLFQTIDESKIELSTKDSASISFAVDPFVSFEENILRSEFEAIIAHRVIKAKQTVCEALAKANISTEDIARVVCVGGSSQVPVFYSMLNEMFPNKVKKGEVFTSISLGLVNAHHLGLSTD